MIIGYIIQVSWINYSAPLAQRDYSAILLKVIFQVNAHLLFFIKYLCLIFNEFVNNKCF